MNEMASKVLALKDYKWCKYIFENAQKGENKDVRQHKSGSAECGAWHYF
ncbi:hypothetical protein R4Z09_21135 [Niallia oryzisoli]|uniref:Uncharacterized protein n=1 Tax=Niallia oryzisoli TaxID=1737571 RepID=A0ABZ2C828_9BACI